MSRPNIGTYVITNKTLVGGVRYAITFNGPGNNLSVTPLSGASNQRWVLSDYGGYTQFIRPQDNQSLEANFGPLVMAVSPRGGYVWSIEQDGAYYSIKDGARNMTWGMPDPRNGGPVSYSADYLQYDVQRWTFQDANTVVVPPVSPPVPATPNHGSSKDAVYYRIYTSGHPTVVKNPAPGINDDDLGITYSHLIPPPHNARNISVHLAKRESIADYAGAELYLNISSQTPVPSGTFVSLGPTHHGSDPTNPILLVLEDKSTVPPTTTGGPTGQPNPTDLLRPVYYRVFDDDDTYTSKHPVPGSGNDPTIGVTYARRVPPPHTARAIKRHIVAREGLGTGGSDLLFLDGAAQAELPDSTWVDITTQGSGAGWTLSDPIVLVHSGAPASGVPPPG